MNYYYAKQHEWISIMFTKRRKLRRKSTHNNYLFFKNCKKCKPNSSSRKQMTICLAQKEERPGKGKGEG